MSARSAVAAAPEQDASDKRSLGASIAVLLLSLPALGAKAFSHTFSLAFTLAILSNLAQYYGWKGSSKSGTHWQRFGPAYLLAMATPLICADMTRHCLQDAGIWTGPSSRMYRPDCGPVHGLHGILCLSLTGWLFSITFTYSGFALMITAVIWSSGILQTVRKAWAGILQKIRKPSAGIRR